MKRLIRIGTRSSELAVWQARHVQTLLQAQGAESELVYIKSDGEVDLVSPLYEMGVQGIFTKALDVRLLNGSIDLAVHSLKDVPTGIPSGLCLAAVPPRADASDVLVLKDASQPPQPEAPFTVATSSLRRKAQWLHRYPAHRFELLRGNINTRLEKVKTTPYWGGALFALAGIERIGLQVPGMLKLPWMLPAPAQGALAIVVREDDHALRSLCGALNHRETALCTQAERQFLRYLMGGCSMPIAAYAEIQGNQLLFKGNVLSMDGSQKAEVTLSFEASDFERAGEIAATRLLEQGGRSIVESFGKHTHD